MEKINQLAWTFRNLKQSQRTYVTQTINQMKKTFGMDFFYDVTKPLQTCAGTLGMPGQIHQKNGINLQKTFLFINMKNMNLITQFFLEILQKSCMLVILRTLGMPRQNHQKWQHQFTENVNAHLHNSSSSPNSSLRYYRG